MNDLFDKYDSPTEKSKKNFSVYMVKKGNKKVKTINTYMGGIEREKSRQLISAYFNSSQPDIHFADIIKYLVKDYSDQVESLLPILNPPEDEDIQDYISIY